MKQSKSPQQILQEVGKEFEKKFPLTPSIIKAEIKRLEEILELHTHNSIPNYTESIEEGCVICIKNQVLKDQISHLKELKR